METTKVATSAEYAELMVCLDCLFVLSNDEWGDVTPERSTEILAGFERLAQRGFVVVGDSSRDNDFSIRPCECCGSKLHGSRHLMIWIQP